MDKTRLLENLASLAGRYHPRSKQGRATRLIISCVKAGVDVRFEFIGSGKSNTDYVIFMLPDGTIDFTVRDLRVPYADRIGDIEEVIRNGVVTELITDLTVRVPEGRYAEFDDLVKLCGNSRVVTYEEEISMITLNVKLDVSDNGPKEDLPLVSEKIPLVSKDMKLADNLLKNITHKLMVDDIKRQIDDSLMAGDREKFKELCGKLEALEDKAPIKLYETHQR